MPGTKDSESQSSRAAYMRERNARLRGQLIEPCRNVDRRDSCLADPREFLTTYAGASFYIQPWSKAQNAIIDAYVDAMQYGGNQAMGAPRGEGKSTLLRWLMLWGMLNSRSTFPIVVTANKAKAAEWSVNFKGSLTERKFDLLAEDFPGLVLAARYVAQASVRARGLLINGQHAPMQWAGNGVRFPDLNDPEFPECVGQTFRATSFDSSDVRGTNVLDMRPSLILIDDPDDKKSSRSEAMTKARIEATDQDLAQMAAQGGRQTIFLIGTCPTRLSMAYQFTDPEQRPAYRGRRVKLIESMPEDMTLSNLYIAKRLEDLKAGDAEYSGARAWYREHREEIEAGWTVTNENRHDSGPMRDGFAMQESSVQWCLDEVCKLIVTGEEGGDGWGPFLAEVNCDPPATEAPVDRKLSANAIKRRFSGYPRGMVPGDSVCVTAFCDVGGSWLYWAAVAWAPDMRGRIVDYGPVEVGEAEAQEQAILDALWRLDGELETSLFSENGECLAPDLFLIDARWKRAAVHKFVEESTGYGDRYPAVGHGADNMYRVGAYRAPQAARAEEVGNGWWYGPTTNQPGFAIHHDADRWKERIVDGWQCEIEAPGAITVPGSPDGAADRERLAASHNALANHQTAEVMREKHNASTGRTERRFVKLRKNNHLLDCLAGCAAAAAVLGHELTKEPAAEGAAPAAPVDDSPSIVSGLTLPSGRGMFTGRGG